MPCVPTTPPASVSGVRSRQDAANPNSGSVCFVPASLKCSEAIYLIYYPFFRKELAAALGAAGRVDDGLGEINETSRLAEETGYQWFVPELLRTKGDLLARRGTDEPALIEDLYRQSMSQARLQQAVYWELSAATSLAKLLQNQHRDAEGARSAFAGIRSFHRRLFCIKYEAGQGSVGSLILGLVDDSVVRRPARAG